VTTNAVTGSVGCNATFQYVSGDVYSAEANLYCLRMSPLTTYSAANTGTHTLSANGLTSFGAFTGGHGALNSGLTVYLQGPYSTGSHNMNTTLKTANLIPLSQPYSGSPWNYSGAESVTSIPANVVDWILVELRQADVPAHATTALARRAAFLLNNGTVVDLDGVSAVNFYNVTLTQNLFPVIWHRNHMPIIAANVAGMNSSGTYAYDYSTGSGQVYGGANGCRQIDTSPVRWGMMAADASNDGNIYANDYTDYWIPEFGQTSTYQPGDFNLDGNIYANDYTDYWIPNFGLTNPLPHP